MASTDEYAMLATRLAHVEAAVARLVGTVERVVDVMADARPLLLTTAQLADAVRTAMRSSTDIHDEPTATPPTKKRKTAPHATNLQSTLTLATLDAVTSESPRPSPPTRPPPPPPPPIAIPAKKKAARTKVAAPPPPPVPPAPVQRPPVVTAPTRVVAVAPAVPQHVKPQQALLVPPSKTPGERRYLWGNAWHYLPEDYEFPKESVETMWRQWCCGVADQGILPLREVKASDIATSNNRKRLSDLKFLMKFIEQHLQDRGVWKERPTETEADQMLLAVRKSMPFTATTAKNGQKRELEGLKWHTAVTMLRNANKKVREE